MVTVRPWTAGITTSSGCKVDGCTFTFDRVVKILLSFLAFFGQKNGCIEKCQGYYFLKGPEVSKGPKRVL